MVIRATSKRLCFIASMPRSKSTLSGCLESTFARGLLTFLLVQAVVSANVRPSAITGVRKDMKEPQNKRLPAPSFTGELGTGNQELRLDFLHGGFQSSPKQIFCISLRIAMAEHCVARHQNFCSGPHYPSDCIESHS